MHLGIVTLLAIIPELSQLNEVPLGVFIGSVMAVLPQGLGSCDAIPIKLLIFLWEATAQHHGSPASVGWG